MLSNKNRIFACGYG